MQLSIIRLVVAIQLFGSAAFAADPFCAPASYVKQMNTWNAPVVATASSWTTRASGAEALGRVVDDVIVLRADQQLLPRPDGGSNFDLEGASIVFTPTGDGYQITRGPLQYQEDVGTLLHSFDRNAGKGWFSTRLPLSRMSFPFGSSNLSELHLTATLGIYPEAQQDPAFAFDLRPPHPLELVNTGKRVIAPLLLPPFTRVPDPDLYVAESSEAVVLTWRARPTHDFDYDIQVVLRATGEITFSYRTVRAARMGTLAVLHDHSEWWGDRELIANFEDPEGDVSDASGPSGAPDLRRVQLERVGSSEFLEIVLETFTTLEGAPTHPYRIRVTADDVELVTAALTSTTSGHTGYPAGSKLEPNRITLRFGDRGLRGSARLRVETFVLSTAGDTAETDVNFGDRGAPLGIDFSNLPITPVKNPIAAGFSLPSLSPHAVWATIEDQFGYTSNGIDAVAIYSKQLTDLVYYGGAYSLFANAGVDGIGSHLSAPMGSGFERSVSLMHLGTPGVTANVPPYRQMIVAHELGHRWLYYADVIEGGEPSKVLHLDQAHPLQYVDTRAAFPLTPYDFSCMGGGYFIDNADGSFSTPDQLRGFGYSWHELYLMGLADASEVPPWSYIADAPELALPYAPAPGMRVEGTRRTLTIEQLIGANGPRFPSYQTAQKAFRVLFVLIDDDRDPLTPADIAEFSRNYREDFEQYFDRITGGRGAIVTTALQSTPGAAFQLEIMPERRVRFRDRSTGGAIEWQWDFGDGSSSQQRNPIHTYAAPGTYEVRLTVRNADGESQVTKAILLSPSGGRKRGVRPPSQSTQR